MRSLHADGGARAGGDSSGAGADAGDDTRTMRAGVYSRKGIVRVEEGRWPEVGDAKC